MLPAVEKLGQDTLTTIAKAGADTTQTLQKAAGDTVTTVTKAGGDSIRTVVQGVNDTGATYFKAWRDTGEQAKRSFEDVVDAGKAAAEYTKNQLEAQRDAANSAARRVREGKVVDAMWGLATEPAQATERNFATATQKSSLLNTAAASAAAIYGGPGGAAAYAAWSTYRATGDANLALRAGILSAITSQMGSSTAAMPSGTTGELLKKAAMSGAAGGIAVAAAGGDEKAITEGFLKAGGAVVVQGATDRLGAYSPKAKDAYQTVKCLSEKDVKCLGDTQWARDAKGNILNGKNGKPYVDPKLSARAQDAYQTIQCLSAKDVECLGNTQWAHDVKNRIMTDKNGKPIKDLKQFDPKAYVSKWTGIDPNSIEGKKNAFMTKISKLPNSNSIPLMNGKWVLTSTLGKAQAIVQGQPAPMVVLTYVGTNPPFISKDIYGRVAAAAGAVASATAAGAGNFACPFAGYTRTVTTKRSASSCEAIYRKSPTESQILWHSDHDPEICAGKAATFSRSLSAKGVACTSR